MPKCYISARTEDDPGFSAILDQAARKAFSEAYQRAIDSGAEVAVQRGDKVVILQKIDGKVVEVREVADIVPPRPENLAKFKRLLKKADSMHA